MYDHKCNCENHKGMRAPVDPKEARAGYEAVKSDLAYSCKGCALEEADSCKKFKCLPGERKDKRNVIFKEVVR